MKANVSVIEAEQSLQCAQEKRLGHTNFMWLSVAMLEKRQQMETETYFLLFRDKILLFYKKKEKMKTYYQKEKKGWDIKAMAGSHH